MDDTAPLYTHFGTTEAELPVEYYQSIGRSLYRWSQLETTVGTLAVSILDIPWLEAMQRLRGSKGFNTTSNFEMLLARALKRGANDETLKPIENARHLFERRKVLFHSVWGTMTGHGVAAAVGIQEWSNTSYDNFRAVPLTELDSFATECRRTWVELMERTIPFFHGTSAIVIDDSDGMTRGI